MGKREAQLEQAIKALLKALNTGNDHSQPTREELLELTIQALLKVLSSEDTNTYQKLHAAGLLLKALNKQPEGQPVS